MDSKFTLYLIVSICFICIVGENGFADEAVFETTTVWPYYQDNKPNYRIPAFLRAPNGNLLVFAEKRNHGIGDCGNTDIVMKRSTDRGKTWSPEKVIYANGYETHTDCTPVVDWQTGKIWLFFLRDKKRFYAMSSQNNGKTWCKPYSIHKEVVKPNWDSIDGSVNKITSTPPNNVSNPQAWKVRAWRKNWNQRYGVGPGAAAIQKRYPPHAGRLIVPARHREKIDGSLRHFSHVFYSDDQGSTWQLGGTVYSSKYSGNECRLVELVNGDVMINMRDGDNSNRPNNIRRLVAISSDGGQTWGDVYRDEALISPQCEASILRYTTTAEHDKNRILFSNPASTVRQKKHPYGRYNMTVRLSYDEGQTWTAGKTIWRHPSSYSDLAILDDMSIGIAYERGPKGSSHYWDKLQFARFNIEWLTDGKDSVEGDAAPLSGSHAMLTKTDLFEVGEGGCLSYRIPCLVATKEGTILAFCAARKAVSDWADIDIVMRRSTDSGRTWEKRKTIADYGKATVDNPVAIVDQSSGTIHFLHQVDYSRCYYMRSVDDGKSFSEPVEITSVFEEFRPEYNWTVLAPGPGHGIQLDNGRLVVSVWLSNGGGKAHRPSCVSTIYSDDHGKTWHRGDIVVNTTERVPNPSESTLVQLKDGRVMLNIRCESPKHRRLVTYSPNGIGDWSKPSFDDELYDPICFASLIRLTEQPKYKKNRILFVNPDSRSQKHPIRPVGMRTRENLTVRLTYDEGKTWPISRVLEPGRTGYCDLAVGPDKSVYALYERGYIPGNNLNTRYLTIARFNLEWLTNRKDSLNP